MASHDAVCLTEHSWSFGWAVVMGAQAGLEHLKVVPSHGWQ